MNQGVKDMKMATLDGTKLKEIANKNKTSEIVALSLSMRERNRLEVSIDKVRRDLRRQGEEIDDRCYAEYWRDLQELNIGHFRHNRSGKLKIFVFNYDMRAVGKACVNGTDEKALQLTSRPKRKIPYNYLKPKVETDANLPVARADKTTKKPFELSIKLPEGISEARASKLLHVLSTI